MGHFINFLESLIRELKPILAIAETQPYNCQFTESKPAGDWTAVEFDDTKWQTGKGMFGTKDIDPQSVWKSREIWIRRTFDFQSCKY